MLQKIRDQHVTKQPHSVHYSSESKFLSCTSKHLSFSYGFGKCGAEWKCEASLQRIGDAFTKTVVVNLVLSLLSKTRMIVFLFYIEHNIAGESTFVRKHQKKNFH